MESTVPKNLPWKWVNGNCTLVDSRGDKVLQIKADSLENVPSIAHAEYIAEACNNFYKVDDELERLREWEIRAIRSMRAASDAVGVKCCDLIPLEMHKRAK